MFKPLRFNNLLKAVPGLAHLQLTPQAAHHAKSQTYVHVQKQIEVDRTRKAAHGAKETHNHRSVKEDIQVVSKTTERHGTVEHERVTRREVDVRQGQQQHGSSTLERVHVTMEEVATVEMTPPHPPREDTPIYMRTHRDLVFTKDTPCAICGVRHSTLNNPRENPFHATGIETHHYPIERSLLNACDPKRVHVIFPQVKDYDSLEAFVDSEENMMVLCDIHHRHPHYGIHHVLAQDFFIQPFLFGGYQVVAEEGDERQVMQVNERVIQRHHQSEEVPAHTTRTTHTSHTTHRK